MKRAWGWPAGKSSLLVVAWLLLSTTAAEAGSMHVGRPRGGGGPAKWGTPQGHARFYDKMIAKFNKNPKAFSQRYQLMTKALRNPAFNQAMTRRLLAHPARFIRNHPCFARFLDGERYRSVAQTGPSLTGPEGAPTGPVGPTVEESTGTGGTGGGTISPAPPVDPNPPAPPVPEPSSIVLLGLAAVAGGLAGVRRIRRRRGSEAVAS